MNIDLNNPQLFFFQRLKLFDKIWESDEAKENFVSTIKRELLSPLRAITIYSGLLLELNAVGKQTHLNRAEINNYLNKIQDSIMQLNSKTSDFLSPNWLNLNEIINQAIHHA